MNDEELEKVYSRGHGVNHATGLREVYKAGQRHDAWSAEQVRAGRAASDERKRVAADRGQTVDGRTVDGRTVDGQTVDGQTAPELEDAGRVVRSAEVRDARDR